VLRPAGPRRAGAGSEFLSNAMKANGN
jgi:hypothetical protein